jgi:23S rRNA (adenine2503-C2)-methyltransferase
VTADSQRPYHEIVDHEPVSVLDDARLRAVVAPLGGQPWRAEQIHRAVWQPYIEDFSDIRQLPAALREQLDTTLAFSTVAVAGEIETDRGETVKLLCRLNDGLTVETVAMETPAAATARRRATV